MTAPATREYKGPPRWVKISAIIVLVLVLFFAIHFFFIGNMWGLHRLATGG